VALWPIFRPGAVVNLVLGLANLLPVRPLDGWVLWNVFIREGK
jgi:Zn-dependent protease